MSEDVQIILKAIDNASKQLDRIEKEMKQLGDQVEKTAKQTKKSSSAFEGLQKSWTALAAVGISVAGALYSIKKAYDFGKEGAQLEFAAQKFDRLSESIGVTSNVLMTQLREATRGMVADSELVASAGDFMSLGLAKTTDEVVRLTRVAGSLGMDMNQLVLTLTNQTTMRFDALGVAVDGFDEKVEKLKKTGMSASDAFNEAFLQQAEEQIERVGEVADSAAADFIELEVTWKNLVDEIKKDAAGPVKEIVKGINDWYQGTSSLIDVQNQFKDLLDRGLIEYEAYNNTVWAIQDGTIALADAERIATSVQQAWLNSTSDSAEVARRAGANLRKFGNALNEDVSPALKEAKSDAEKVVSPLQKILGMLNRNIRSPIADFRKDLEWMSAGGWKLTAALEEIQGLVAGGKITPAQAEEMLIELEKAAGDLEVELDPTKLNEVSKELGESLNKPVGEMRDYILSTDGAKGALDVIDAMNLTIDVYFKYHNPPDKKNFSVSNNIPEGWGGATGLNAIVPPGFPNDSFPIWTTSGEHVQVTPPGKASSGGGDFIKIIVMPAPGMDEIALAGMVGQVIERNKTTSVRAGAGYTGAH